MTRGSVTGILTHRSVRIACRLVLAAVFIYAASGKILKPEEFADAIAGFRILPIRSVNVFAIVLPWVELLSALSLLSGVLLRSGGLLVAGMNVVFIAAAASAMARGLNIECGCFTLSQGAGAVGLSLIGRDLVFLVLCVPLVSSPVERKLADSRHPLSRH